MTKEKKVIPFPDLSRPIKDGIVEDLEFLFEASEKVRAENRKDALQKLLESQPELQDKVLNSDWYQEVEKVMSAVNMLEFKQGFILRALEFETNFNEDTERHSQ